MIISRRKSRSVGQLPQRRWIIFELRRGRCVALPPESVEDAFIRRARSRLAHDVVKTPALHVVPTDSVRDLVDFSARGVALVAEDKDRFLHCIFKAPARCPCDNLVSYKCKKATINWIDVLMPSLTDSVRVIYSDVVEDE